MSSSVSRRAFLQAGTLGFVGLSLADVLRAERAAGIRGSRKAVVNIHLDGGPPHQDMIDLKPDAPIEIRGEFKPIATRLPGLHVGEMLPKLATIADRFAFIRSLTGAAGAHDAFQCMSGFPAADLQPLGGRPAMGCVVTKLLGSTTDAAPTFVDLMQGRPLVRNSARPGFLGPVFQAFRPDISHMFHRELAVGMQAELAQRGGSQTVAYSLNKELNSGRVDDRLKLLGGLDRLRRAVDGSGMMAAADGFNQQAVGILTSGELARAMDLSQEDARTIDRYKLVGHDVETYQTADTADATLKFLLARRLIEAGVRVVSLTLSDYDTHRDNYPRLRQMLPVLDHGLHAFVLDLEQRGLIDDVSVVVWGEFGRTPKVNAGGGRDHWPTAGMCLLAGGGMRVGQVIGATDRQAASVISRPVYYPDVMATLYRNLGIDPTQTTLIDPTGRPQHIAGPGRVLGEVV